VTEEYTGTSLTTGEMHDSCKSHIITGQRKEGKAASAHTIKAYNGGRDIRPCILHLGNNAGELSAARHSSVIPEKRNMLHTEQQAGWDPEPVLTIRKTEKSLVTEKNESPNFPVSSTVSIQAIQRSTLLFR
jgi:hypothetical protein